MYVKEELNEFVENMMQKAYEEYQSSPAAEQCLKIRQSRKRKSRSWIW